ncbi:MAG: hypothetical protein AAF502_04785 [Bacteroidota bacterium]
MENFLTQEPNRLVFSSFCFLCGILLAYFYIDSRRKIKAAKNDGLGLIKLAIAFILYFVLGFTSVIDTLDMCKGVADCEFDFYKTPQFYYYMLNGAASLLFLSSLSFFTLDLHKIDKFFNHNYWKFGTLVMIPLWALIVLVNFEDAEGFNARMDILLGIFSFLLFGLMLVRYLFLKRHAFLGLFSATYFLVFLGVRIYVFTREESNIFEEMNTAILGPVLVLSVIILSYTFSWVNELTFAKMSDHWLQGNETTDEQDIDPSKWKGYISENEVEKVIHEMMALRKMKGKPLEGIIMLASRNSGNNQKFNILNIIEKEEYDIERNRIKYGLLSMLK